MLHTKSKRKSNSELYAVGLFARQDVEAVVAIAGMLPAIEAVPHGLIAAVHGAGDEQDALGLFLSNVSIGLWTNESSLDILGHAENTDRLRILQYQPDGSTIPVRIRDLVQFSRDRLSDDHHYLWEIQDDATAQSVAKGKVKIQLHIPPVPPIAPFQALRIPDSAIPVSAKRISIIGRQEYFPLGAPRYVRLIAGGHSSDGTRLAGEFLVRRAAVLGKSLGRPKWNARKKGLIRTTLWYLDGEQILATSDSWETWSQLVSNEASKHGEANHSAGSGAEAGTTEAGTTEAGTTEAGTTTPQ